VQTDRSAFLQPWSNDRIHLFAKPSAVEGEAARQSGWRRQSTGVSRVNNISVSRRCFVSMGLNLDIDEFPCAFLCGSRRRGKADPPFATMRIDKLVTQPSQRRVAGTWQTVEKACLRSGVLLKRAS
jgi:hypothetical protein